MDVDGRQITVSGSLLQPLWRRTTDILRVVAATLMLVVVVVGSLITRNNWVDLEQSISRIIGVLSPTQADLVYLAYGLAILALPFVILLELLAARQWRMLWAYGAAAAITFLSLSISENGVSAPNWHFDRHQRFNSLVSQFLDDPRWIAMLAAVLTVSGPWLPARWRRWWWTLLLAFIPIHLVVSSVVPAGAVFGLSTGWLVGSIVVWVVGTPALVVPLESAVRVLGQRGIEVTALSIVTPAGTGPLGLEADSTTDESTSDSDDCGHVVIDLYGPNQHSAGLLRQFVRKIRLRTQETGPLQLSVSRMVEHRGLMAIAVGDVGLADSAPVAVASLDRGWTMYAHRTRRGCDLDAAITQTTPRALWEALQELHSHGIAHGDLRASRITVLDGTVLFGGFTHAEYGANENRMESDIAQMLASTTELYGAEAAVTAAIDVLGEDRVLVASRRLTKTALPSRIRDGLADAKSTLSQAREEIVSQTGGEIQAAPITRFTRSQVIQLVLLVALVYVAYPFISTVPTFFGELRSLDWWWALMGLVVSMLTYVGAAAALWACADGVVSFRNLVIMQFGNTFAATTTPAGVGGLALSTRFLQKGGLGGVRATTAVALQQSVQVIVHVALLIVFTTLAGTSTNLEHFVPSTTVLYLVAGALLGVVGVFLLVPKLRHWLGTSLRPKVIELLTDILDVAREPKRLGTIVLGCATTTLGGALALWASVYAFGGQTSFVTVTVVTMIGGTLASAAPTPGGVGAVEAALIGGLAAFGLPSAVAVPAVLLYRVLTCWLPVFIGWPVMHWMTRKNMI
ncbi:hypothetical protein GOPIP_093_00330 [Gordonia polyisoprenivorans NBRC 16320 = JCM 10675]|uniref:TIGR00374 family protein n=1 Tax=Gordonia polyisoprenivorans TaxID=84595 RepID=A0A846WWY4_9ACTN|nr:MULTISPECIES: lysylphosphatidylglycerol synthase transmembrane domain-containing protein [Gordonia]NKY05153.1 TIGR00374 family protein [Gordonia polyisoprenivorans]OPX15229.1 hypothetical protein B1964_11040 [Gordonia sp. i37]GAB26226.1 hypothetical protein GOPIP_093_00330 [Gordonia polyisoprenivorans NBRC 16320 = JCM 10675]